MVYPQRRNRRKKPEQRKGYDRCCELQHRGGVQTQCVFSWRLSWRQGHMFVRFRDGGRVNRVDSSFGQKWGNDTRNRIQGTKKEPLIICNIITQIQNLLAHFKVKRTREITIRIRKGNSVYPKAVLSQVWLTQRIKQYSMVEVRNVISANGILMPLGPPTSIIIRLLFVTGVTSQLSD